MNPQGNIILVGPMGAGKTTFGKKLAKKLGVTFIDLDEEITRTLGVDILTIFDNEGEQGFRKREKKAFTCVLKNNKNSVIATGGGCVLTEGNRNLMQLELIVIHIDIGIKLRKCRSC